MELQRLKRAISALGFNPIVDEDDDEIVVHRTIQLRLIQVSRTLSGRLSERSFAGLKTQRDVDALTRELAELHTQKTREDNLKQGRIPAGSLSARDVTILVKRGFIR